MSTTITIKSIDYPVGNTVAEYIAKLELNIDDHKRFIDRQSDQLQKAKDLVHHAADENERLKGELAQTKAERECLRLSRSAFQGDCTALQAQLAKYEWVSVEDRLPENDKQVWLAYGGSTYVGYYNKSYKLWYIFNYSGGFTRAEESPDFWKPIILPALPEQEKEGK